MPYKLDIGSVWALKDGAIVNFFVENFVSKVVIKCVKYPDPRPLAVIDYMRIDGQVGSLGESSFRFLFYRLKQPVCHTR